MVVQILGQGKSQDHRLTLNCEGRNRPRVPHHTLQGIDLLSALTITFGGNFKETPPPSIDLGERTSILSLICLSWRGKGATSLWRHPWGFHTAGHSAQMYPYPD